MRRRSGALFAAGVGVLLLGGACGGSGADEPATSASRSTAATAGATEPPPATTAAAAEPLTLEAWAEQASAICREVEQQAEQTEEPTDVDGIVTALDRQAGLADDAVARLRDLPPPADRAAEITALIDLYAGLNEELRAAAAALRADPASAEATMNDFWSRMGPAATAIEQGALELRAYGCAGLDAEPPVVAPVAYADEPRGVVVDTDMAPDDWIALLYLLQRRDVDVLALAITGAGEAHCGPGVDNARRLLQLAGQPDVPVACGRERPLAGTTAFPAEWRQAADDLLGLDLPAAPEPAPAAADAVALLRSAVEEATAPVSVLTLGPLTNVAQALEADPALARRLGGIWVMGGAVGVPGNVEGGAPEWNLHVDPAAADAVLRSGADVTLVALDATSQVPVTRGFVQGLRDAHGTPVADFVLDVLEAQQGAIDAGGYDFWDPLAAAALVDPTLVTVEEHPLVVSRTGELAGWTSIRSDGTPTSVAVGADRLRFEQVLLSVLNEP
jgi:pyrimidine-specific ribonucleoside hydrolase